MNCYILGNIEDNDSTCCLLHGQNMHDQYMKSCRRRIHRTKISRVTGKCNEE